jgi:hypothetical protein
LTNPAAQKVMKATKPDQSARVVNKVAVTVHPSKMTTPDKLTLTQAASAIGYKAVAHAPVRLC